MQNQFASISLCLVAVFGKLSVVDCVCRTSDYVHFLTNKRVVAHVQTNVTQTQPLDTKPSILVNASYNINSNILVLFATGLGQK